LLDVDALDVLGLHVLGRHVLTLRQLEDVLLAIDDTQRSYNRKS
jgi:hypothetical protein